MQNIKEDMRFFLKKKSIQYVMCKKVYVHQNYLITNIIQHIFCLPQAKKCIQCWNFFGWTFPLSANPTPQMISLVESIRISVEKSSDVSGNQCCWQDQWNPQGRVCAELVWEKNTQILQLPAVFNYAGNGKSNQACCIVGYSILCSSVEYFTFCLTIPCIQNICILCTVYKVYCIL